MSELNYKYKLNDGDQFNQIGRTNIVLNNLIKQTNEYAIYDKNVESTPLIGGNNLKKYIINDSIKFKSNEKNPEKIAAKLVEPKNRNIEYLFTIREVGEKKNEVYKLVKKDGRIKNIKYLH